jgi:hypothetical protein
MSATELIKQVAALRPQERTLFEQLFQTMEKESNAPLTLAPAATWPDFGERLRRIYGDKIASDSHSIIDDGRGDR